LVTQNTTGKLVGRGSEWVCGQILTRDREAKSIFAKQDS